MKHLLWLTIVLISGFAKGYAQSSLKTQTVDLFSGKATFQYYEDPETSEYVKHGSFKFIESDKRETGTDSVVVTGQFKNGFRDGLWTYSLELRDYPNLVGSYTTRTMKSTQTFKEGLAHGSWLVNDTWKSRNRHVFKGVAQWGKFSETSLKSISTTFNNGIMSGTLQYNLEGKQKSFKLNDKGFVVGTVNNADYISTEEMQFNDKGVMTKYVQRSLSTGKVEEKIDFDAELLGIADEFLLGNLSNADLKRKSIKVDTLQASFIPDLWAELFNEKYFQLSNTGGYKKMTKTDSKRAYGAYLRFTRIERVQYDRHPNWPRPLWGGRASVEKYREFLKQHSFEIREGDVEIVEQIIKEEQEENERARLNKHYKDEYYRFRTLINKEVESRREKFHASFKEIDINSYELQKSIGRGISTDVYYIKGVYNGFVRVLNSVTSTGYACSINGAVTLGSQNTQKSYKKEYEEALAKKEKYEKEYLPLYERAYSLQTVALNSIGQVESTISNYKKSSNFDSKTFEYYKEFIELYSMKIEKSSLDDMEENLSVVSMLNAKMQLLTNAKNKELLKALKKEKDVEKRIEIFIQ